MIKWIKSHNLLCECECDSMGTLRQSVMGNPLLDQKNIKDLDVRDVRKTTRQIGIFQRV